MNIPSWGHRVQKKEDWKLWSWKLRSAATLVYKDVNQILDWAQEKDETPILDSDVAAQVNTWPNAQKIHDQLHAIPIKKFEIRIFPASDLQLERKKVKVNQSCIYISELPAKKVSVIPFRASFF